MPRTDTPRTRITARRGTRVLAVAGAAAALAGTGTAVAASAATVPAPGLAPGHAVALTPAGHHTVLTPAPAATAQHPATARHAATAQHAAKPEHAVTAAKAAHARHEHARHLAGQVKPYEMYDSVTPTAIPGGKAVATYATGPYAASPADVAGRHVTWIDTNGTDPKGATVLDVEPGDATPAGAAAWAAQRLDAHPGNLAVIYTMRSEWPATQTAIASLPHWQQHHVRWWIADPTGTPHVVPGSDATQWYWGTHYDISTVNPGF
jgi:hypothetical protein